MKINAKIENQTGVCFYEKNSNPKIFHLIFANEYHSEIALIKDEEKMSQAQRNNIILSNTINYLLIS